MAFRPCSCIGPLAITDDIFVGGSTVEEGKEGEVSLSRQDAVDPLLNPDVPPQLGSARGNYFSFITEPSLSNGDLGMSMGMSMMSYMSPPAEMEGDFSDLGNGMDGPEMVLSDTELYSWGRADLGCLFIDPPHGAPETPSHFVPVRSKYSKKNFGCISTSLYHTVASSNTGEVYGSGINEDGQVLHDRKEEQFNSPILVEPLLSQRVIQVSCGDNHTACLIASGAIITYGNNEVGQLGHSKGSVSRIGPRTVVGLGGKVVKQVSCGYLFTLALTSDGEVFSFGVGGCVGTGDGENRYTPERIAALRFVPVAYLAAGYSHAMAVTVTGQVWGWGHNSHGQTGVPNDGTVQVSTSRWWPYRFLVFDHLLIHLFDLQEPRLIQGIASRTIVTVACGQSHSVFISQEGDVSGKRCFIVKYLGRGEG